MGEWEMENENTLHGTPVASSCLSPTFLLSLHSFFPKPICFFHPHNPYFPYFPGFPITRAQDHIPLLPPTFSHYVPMHPIMPFMCLCVLIIALTICTYLYYSSSLGAILGAMLMLCHLGYPPYGYP